METKRRREEKSEEMKKITTTEEELSVGQFVCLCDCRSEYVLVLKRVCVMLC